MKFRDIYNPLPTDYPREDVDQSSIAVPDQSLTVRQIIDRSLRGIVDPSQLYRRSTDDINPDIDDESEDLTDIVDIHNAYNQYAEISQRSRNNRQHTDGNPDGASAAESESSVNSEFGTSSQSESSEAK